MSSLMSLVPERVKRLSVYSSARREAHSGEIWLNANENPSSPGLDSASFNRYPEPQPVELLEAYAAYAGARPEQLLVTRGIDEGIELLIRTFCEPGRDDIIITPPTYGMYEISAQSLGVGGRELPLDEGWELDLELFASQDYEQVGVIFICSPNNPTGKVVSRKDLERLMRLVDGSSVVAVDEAYIEYCPGESALDLLDAYENLVILRTLSKGFGLAGLRCGFVVGDEALIAVMNKVVAPYPIPTPVVELASQALEGGGIAAMKDGITATNAAAIQVVSVLSKLPDIEVHYSGQANFLLLELVDADQLMSTLSSQGIIIRDRSSQFQKGMLRVTVGNESENKALIEAVAAFRRKA